MKRFQRIMIACITSLTWGWVLAKAGVHLGQVGVAGWLVAIISNCAVVVCVLAATEMWLERSRQ